MKRTIPIRYFIIFDVILTIIMTGYWTITDTASNTLAIAAAIFIAALQLIYFPVTAEYAKLNQLVSA